MKFLPLVGTGLVVAGVAILAASLFPVRQLIAGLPGGRVRRRWYLLGTLTVLFIAGYAGYAVAFWGRGTAGPDLLVPGIFFAGACFVWLTCTLSLHTAMDVRRVVLLEHENITDPLIGIYNRRYMERRLEEEFARAHRYALPLSLLLVDIDHFKQVNDTYGHPAGDRVLGYLGKLTLDAIRHSDIAARYGGDEILVIAPHTALNSAEMLAERLREHVESHALELTHETGRPQEVRITISIGVASLGQDVDSIQSLVQQADRALYKAKQGGRNRFAIYALSAAKQPED